MEFLYTLRFTQKSKSINKDEYRNSSQVPRPVTEKPGLI